MAVKANVTILFDAISKDDVDSIVASWTLHEGCTVYVQVSEEPAAYETGEGGRLTVREPPPPPPLAPESVNEDVEPASET